MNHGEKIEENISEFIIHSSTQETKYEWLQRNRIEMNEDESRVKIIEMLLAKYAKGSVKFKKSNNMKRAFNILLDRGFSYDDAFEFILLLYV
jgi:hypothetical protein